MVESIDVLNSVVLELLINVVFWNSLGERIYFMLHHSVGIIPKPTLLYQYSLR